MKKSGVALAVFFYLGALSAHACDLCGCYTPQIEARPDSADFSAFQSRFYFAVAEQFTHFGMVQLDGEEVASHGKFSAEFAAELPVSIDNTALQVVPDYRLRGSVGLRF